MLLLFPVKMTPEEQRDAVAKYAPKTGESLLRKGGVMYKLHGFHQIF